MSGRQTAPELGLCVEGGCRSFVLCGNQKYVPSSKSTCASPSSAAGQPCCIRPAAPLSATFTPRRLNRIVVVSCGKHFTPNQTLMQPNISAFLAFEGNNYALNNDIIKACERFDTSVWISLPETSLSNTKWVDAVTHIVNNQLKDLDNWKGLQAAVGVCLLTDVEDARLPAALSHLTHHPTLPAHEGQVFADRLAKVDHLVTSSMGELFQTCRVEMTASEHLTDHLKRVLTSSFTRLIDALDDNGSSLRAFLQQNLGLPHVQVKEVNSQEHKLLISVRPVRTGIFKLFVAQCLDNRLGGIWAELLGLPPTIQIRVTLDEAQVTRTNRLLLLESDKLEREKLQVLLKTDNSGLIPERQLLEKNQAFTQQGLIFFSKILEESLSNKKRTPAEFLKMITSRDCELRELTRLRSANGFPVLHLVIKARRGDFLDVLFQLGLWGDLRQQIVQPRMTHTQDSDSPPPQYLGYTPHRFAESFSLSESGMAILKKFRECDSKWDSLTKLDRMCCMGNYQLVRAMIQSSATSMPGLRLDTAVEGPLFYATGSGNLRLVKYLLAILDLEKGLAKLTRNKLVKCFVLATSLGHDKIADSMLLKIQDISDDALEVCAAHGDVTRATRLIELHNKKWTAKCLMLAAQNHQETFVKKFLQVTKTLKINVDEGKDSEGRNALHHSVINGSVKIVKMLLSHGADITITDLYHMSVIHMAAEHSQLDIMKLLIAKAKESGIVRKLLNQQDFFVGSDTHYILRGKANERRAWHSVELNRMTICKFQQKLKSGQVDVALFGKLLNSGYGSEPGMDIITALANKKEATLKECRKDRAPLHVAVITGSQAITELLLQEGADPDVKDNVGATAAHYAGIYGHVSIISLLERHHADMSVTTHSGLSVTQVARLNDQTEVCNFLQSAELLTTVQGFLQAVDERRDAMEHRNLDKLRQDGSDLRQSMIGTLRELNIDVNIFLSKLGSGPISSSN